MKLLSYSEYINKKKIEGFETIFKDNIRSNNNFINNSNDINSEIKKIVNNKYYDMGYKELETGKTTQRLDDYKSVIMQEKYVFALSGLTIASLIILTTQL